MKSIYLTEEEKEKLLMKFLDEFKKEIDNYSFKVNDKSFTLKAEFGSVAKEKVLIIYTQQAYMRMRSLVDYFDTEVSWYGLVSKLDDKTYLIYDVKICKQYVDGAKVDTEDDDTLEFFNNLTDDEAEHMHFQAHSHVNMSTSASAVDLQNQSDVIRNIGKTGFYIFQIWNKKEEISTYLYDLDNNIFYDSKDVEIDIEDSLGTMTDYILSVKDLVCKKKYPYTWTPSKKSSNTMYDEYYKGWEW